MQFAQRMPTANTMQPSLPHANPRPRTRIPSEENLLPGLPSDHGAFAPPKHVQANHAALAKAGSTSSQSSSSTTPIHPSVSASSSIKPTPSTLNRSSSAVFRPSASKPTPTVPTPSRALPTPQALIDQLTSERDDLCRKLDATSACASRLESDLVQERSRSTHLASQLERVSNDVEKLQLTIAELRKMNATLEGTLAESVEQAEQLWVELERDRGLLSEYQELCNDAVQENDMYRAWLAQVGEDPDNEQKREEMMAIATAEAETEGRDVEVDMVNE